MWHSTLCAVACFGLLAAGTVRRCPDGSFRVIGAGPCPPLVSSTTLAFPNAAGFGAYASGGRGGDVYRVTNTNADGAGSLKYGLDTATGPRTIVFAVSGTITGGGGFTNNWTADDITIAGETAPGDGICIKAQDWGPHSCNNVIIRYLRFRAGDWGTDPGAYTDTFNAENVNRMILDHCTFSWGEDETVGLESCSDITLQRCMVYEGLVESGAATHGLLFTGADGSNRGITIYRCLFARNTFRNPLVSEYSQIVNNIFYDYATYGNMILSFGEMARANIVNNAYMRGPNTTLPVLGNSRDIWFGIASTETSPTAYLSGNGIDTTADGSQSFGTTPQTEGAYTAAGAAIDMPTVTTVTAAQAYTSVINDVGCNKDSTGFGDGKGDSRDLAIIGYVEAGTGGAYPDSEADAGGFPTLTSSAAPTDTDADGIPDAYEIANGLDETLAADRNYDADGNGWTELEEYLHSLVP